MDAFAVTDRRVEVEADFDFLSAEYRALYAASAATAFQAPLWMHHLHHRLGPALGARQHTVTVRDAAGMLLAVFPFVIQRSSGVTLLQPADFGVCDYNAVVAEAGMLEELAADSKVVGALGRSFRPCDLVMFRKIRADGFDPAPFFGRVRVSEGENAAYAIPVDEDLDHWRLKVLKRKFTKELGRLQRQAESRYGTYEHRLATSPEDVAAAMTFLRDCREDRFEGNLLERPEYFDFYRDYAIAAAESGEALTYVSYLGGEPVAVLFGLAGDGGFHATLIASDIRSHAQLSAGLQILYRVARLRREEGHGVLDMCLGDSGYKMHFRPVKTSMHNMTKALSLRGVAVSAIYHHAKPLKNLLRKGAQNVR